MKYGFMGVLSEERIEHYVECATDRADRRFMAGQLSQSDYDAEMAEIAHWANRKYAERA